MEQSCLSFQADLFINIVRLYLFIQCWIKVMQSEDTSSIKMLTHTLGAFYRHVYLCVYYVQTIQALMGIQPTDSSRKVLIYATLVCIAL